MSPPGYRALSVEELEQAMAGPAPPLTLDIRTASQISESGGTIQGSSHLSVLNEEGRAIPNLGAAIAAAAPRTDKVVLLDENGMLAAELAYNMAENGWSDVSVLKGGLQAWQEAGLPLVLDAGALNSP